MTLLLLLLFSF